MPALAICIGVEYNQIGWLENLKYRKKEEKHTEAGQGRRLPYDMLKAKVKSATHSQGFDAWYANTTILLCPLPSRWGT